MKRCKRCIMDDSSDIYIRFDSDGYCSYCNKAIENLNKAYNDENKSVKLNQIINTIKQDGIGLEYDCLMGISGGLDSTYLAYIGAIKWGLRICAIHVDDGFDTALSVQNIKRLCDHCNIKLITIKPDKEQYLSLTRAFIRAEVPNIAIPQDNILFAILYQYAQKHNLKYFLSGSNLSLESIIQKGNTYTNSDVCHIKAINRKFGEGKIDKLPLLSMHKIKSISKKHDIHTLALLNYIDYNKKEAIAELERACGFEYYKAKHLENTLTKVIQLKWFVEKFKVDKHKSHLSSLIVSGQMTREEALLELEKPMYDAAEMKEDVDYILSELNISEEEFNTLLKRKGIQHTEYPTDPIWRIHVFLHRYFYMPIRRYLKK